MDRLKLIRQIIFNSISVQVCAIFMVTLVVFQVPFHYYKWKNTGICYPEAENIQDEPGPGEITTVYIKNNGVVFVDDEEIFEISRIKQFVKKECIRLWCKKEKVLLKADVETPFDKIREVLSGLAKAKVKVVGLITHEKTTGDCL